jgi:ferredoxin
VSGRRVLDSGLRLEIDRITCDAYGACAELLPEGIDLDEWGYPVLAPGNVPAHLVELAKRAVDACPVLALRLVKAVAPAPTAPPPPAPVLAARPDRTDGTPPWPPRPASKQAKRAPDRRSRRS